MAVFTLHADEMLPAAFAQNIYIVTAIADILLTVGRSLP